MLAKQISKDGEIFCTSDMPLAEVFRKMMELNCSCMPVVESPTHKNIIGTITEHDICLKIINDGLNPQRISAGRVMNGHFQTVSGETSVEDCLELLKLTGTDRLFVIDDDHAFTGILTENDLREVNPPVNLETVITDLQKVSPALPKEIHLAF